MIWKEKSVWVHGLRSACQPLARQKHRGLVSHQN
uniref:Uncharacterized protein n=1 Tax=Anguilla anguilla TaxID=7936 RepID=A0A0E9UDY9_ANGAN